MLRFEFARLSASAAALTLALSGCVTAPPAGTPATGGEAQRPRPTNPPPMTVPTPAPSVRPGAFIPPRVMNMPGLEGVIGRNQTALANIFGPPRIDVTEGDAKKLQFAGEACVLDVYLYPLRPGGEQPSAFRTRFAEAGYRSSIFAGRIGRATRLPPQFGQVPSI